MANTLIEESSAGLVVTVACHTDKGRTRVLNEDACIICDLAKPMINMNEGLNNHPIGERGLLLAVADGMGGALAGEVASQLAIEQIIRRLTAPSQKPGLAERLADGLKSANRAVRRAGQDDLKHSGMGATMTAALLQGRSAVLGQVGDSRGYLIRGDEVRQMTKDQSLVQVLIDVGQLTQDEAKGSPQRHVVLQALGAQDDLEPEVSIINLEPGDHLMLCSDYLMLKVTKVELIKYIREAESLSDACERLVLLANLRGGEDNITVLVARFDSLH